jgi:formamidopyrimidine-DNA glycosylase
MPELPEVETVRLQLLRKIQNKTITNVIVYHQKTVSLNPDIQSRLQGQTISHIDRIGKLLIFCFANNNNLFLLGHLKMTGQFFFVDDNGAIVGGGHSENGENVFPHKHSRVAFEFGDEGTLYFNDMRLFGYLKLATKQEMEFTKNAYGPEPTNPNFDSEWFKNALKTKKTYIKAILLNQKFIAGLGNIYVDEALFRAKIAPKRAANKLTDKEARSLAKASGDVMNESIKVGGTTFQHFIDTDGNKGNFTNYLKVFGRQGTPCPVCKTTIIKIRVAGRGTHYCPHCQK